MGASGPAGGFTSRLQTQPVAAAAAAATTVAAAAAPRLRAGGGADRPGRVHVTRSPRWMDG